jgi:hypothetical protein
LSDNFFVILMAAKRPEDLLLSRRLEKQVLRSHQDDILLLTENESLSREQSFRPTAQHQGRTAIA